MSLLKRKYLNELFETQDFRPGTQKGQRSTCHYLHMAALTPIRSIISWISKYGVLKTANQAIFGLYYRIFELKFWCIHAILLLIGPQKSLLMII